MIEVHTYLIGWYQRYLLKLTQIIVKGVNNLFINNYNRLKQAEKIHSCPAFWGTLLILSFLPWHAALGMLFSVNSKFKPQVILVSLNPSFINFRKYIQTGYIRVVLTFPCCLLMTPYTALFATIAILWTSSSLINDVVTTVAYFGSLVTDADIRMVSSDSKHRCRVRLIAAFRRQRTELSLRACWRTSPAVFSHGWVEHA